MTFAYTSKALAVGISLIDEPTAKTPEITVSPPKTAVPFTADAFEPIVPETKKLTSVASAGFSDAGAPPESIKT